MNSVSSELQNIFEPLKREYFRSQKDKNIDLFTNNWIWEISILLDKIENLDTGKFQDVNNLFAKLDSCLKICDFLRETSNNKLDDTDQVIITLLVSLAEWAYRTISPHEDYYELVRLFFWDYNIEWEEEHEDKVILHKISSYVDLGSNFCDENILNKIRKSSKCMSRPTFGFAETLYNIRNDYIHNHNQFWVFFKISDIPQSIYYYYKPIWENMKDIIWKDVVICSGVFKLNYCEFLWFFLRSFKRCIEQYININ